VDDQVAAIMAFDARGNFIKAFGAGKLLDLWGRKAGGAVIYLCLAAGVAGAYQLHGVWPLTAALTLALFGVSAQPAVLNAYTTELFPTEVRGEAFGWSNNLLGRIGYVVGPALVGKVGPGTPEDAPRTRAVTVEGRPVSLTRKEFDLLLLLAREPGVVFRREQIISEVWNTSWEGVGRTLEVHVASLRVKLGAPGLIQTVRGVGYRLCVPGC